MSEESQTPTPNATAHSLAAQRYGTAVQGRFDLQAELGRGSSGTVYRARLLVAYDELPAGADVAIKFLRPDLIADPRAVERFRAEGEVGQRLQHDNLAAMYGMETVTVDGHEVTFLVMEYVAGKTLRQFLAAGELPVEDLVRRVGADAAAGLSALHRRGLAHRDIKPENLILTPQSQLEIVDLGLVRSFGAPGSGSGPAGTSSGCGLGGSIAYAAPESLRGDRGGPKGDVYSLGIVLYELATGRHPFGDRRGADEMIDAHLNAAPPPPVHLRPNLSPFLGQLLLDLLQKDPDRRPRSGELHRILAQGEQCDWWRKREAQEPVHASRRRLRRLRRAADTPFCGRTAEIAALDAALAAAAAGKGSVVLVTGPLGSGRRRLCDHVMERWLREDAPLLFAGEADAGLGRAEPFAGMLLDLLLRGDDADSPQAEARAAAVASTRFALGAEDALALARVALGHSKETPEVRADRLASALLALAATSPLVLRIDHAGALDTSGRLVLQRLCASAPRLPLLVVLTGGLDSDVGHLRRIELSGLDEAEFLAFARALFRAGDVEDAFVLTAHQIVSGVPGQFIEALDHLVHEGQLAGQPGSYHALHPGLELRPAPDHLARIHRHVARLAAAEREVLSAAAVLGRSCLLADLVALLGRSELAVLETLSLFRGRIVRAQGGQVWFRHRDFQRVLLDSIAPATHRDLHLRAAAHFARRDRDRLVIGLHQSQALDHEGCIEPLLDGLDELVRSGSRRTALRIIGRLGVHLAHVPPGPVRDRQQLRFLLLQAAARRNAGQRTAVTQSFREAEALARQLGDVAASAEARTGLAAGGLDEGHLLAAIAILEAVHDDLAACPGARADHAAANAHGLHGRILLYRGQAVEGHRHLQAALRRLPADRDELRAQLLVDLARLEALQYHYTTAQKTLRSVDKMTAVRHLPQVALRLHLYRGQVRAMIGDGRAAQDLRFALDEAVRLALPGYGARAALFLAERQFWRGRDDEARELFARAHELAGAGGDRLGETMARTWLFRLGGTDDGLPAAVEELALPEVTINWLLSRAGRGVATAADLALLEALVADTDLPLAAQLRALVIGNRPASARSLARTIADRLPDRDARRRFLAQWPAGARI